MNALQQRFNTTHDHSPLDTLQLTHGSLDDYNHLKAFHYRAPKPATATRVLVFRHTRRSAVDRFRNQPAQAQPVAVLVESMPSLSCKMRNWALHDRYGAWLDTRQRALLVNSEVRVISRVVVHPCWRGLGLAVRLVRAALAKPTTLYTEALAAMGRVNPFLQRAGMTAYHRPPHAYDARLIDALIAVHLAVRDLAAPKRLHTTIEQLPEPKRNFIQKELHRWYRQNAGRSTTHSTDPVTHIQTARQRLTLEPVYYLHDNRARFNDN